MLTPFGSTIRPQVSWMCWLAVHPPKRLPPFGRRAFMLTSNPL